MKRLALILAIALPLAADDALLTLARVWANVKYRHPQSLQREIDFDGMLVRAVPKVRAAKTDAETAAAIGEMLAELKDPLTKVSTNELRKPTGENVQFLRTEGETLVVNLGPYSDAVGADNLYPSRVELSKALGGAKGVVFDLRSRGTDEFSWIIAYAEGLVTADVPPLPMRSTFHSGYAPQQGSTSGGYYSAIQTVLAGGIPVRPNPEARSHRIVFVTDGTMVPLLAAALWFNGNALIVSERKFGDEAAGEVESVEIGGSHAARIRVSELATSGLAPDFVVPRGTGDAAMRKALDLAAATTPVPARPAVTSSAFRTRTIVEKPYPDMLFPDLPHRMLALIRAWTILDTFYPYKELISDWDTTFREMAPRFADASSALEYVAAVNELVARVEDGHSGAYGHPANLELLGAWRLPADIRYVEGAFIVAAKQGNFPEGAPLAIGDVIVSVDGEPIEERVQRHWKYRTASTEEARRNRVVNTAVRGPKDSVAKLGVRQSDGSTRVVEVPRVAVYADPPEPKEPPYRILEGNIGYADLTRLTPMQVDAMFDALMNTSAIVFDMRGYPKGTAWPIAPRINTRKAKYGASFRRVQIPRDGDAAGYYFKQELPKSDKPVYQGQTVMLIDDRAISQSEHTGLFFEAANGTKFIGSNSAGANGDVTTFTLPGGITIGFTGHDVRHEDGRQLQRIGLVPDIRVVPTIQGIREGKDEVLARAIAYLKTGK